MSLATRVVLSKKRTEAVEPVIGHLKRDYPLISNYLKGAEGEMINTIKAAVLFNMMKKLRQIRDAIYFGLDQFPRVTRAFRLSSFAVSPGYDG